MLEPILDRFRSYLQRVKFRSPQIPFVSNRTGTWITDAQATNAEYWVEHLRGSVEFADCLATVLQRWPESVFVEVGPGTALTSLVRLQPAYGSGHNLVTSLRHRDQAIVDADMFLTSIGRLWASGLPLAEEHHESRGRRIPLPTYAFQRRPYWIEPPAEDAPRATALRRLSRICDPSKWYSVPKWEQVELSSDASTQPCRWLVFLDDGGVGEELVSQLRSSLHIVTVVRQGFRNAKLGDTEYVIDPLRSAEGYDLLVHELDQDKNIPDRILHMWMLGAVDWNRTHLNRFSRNLNSSFYSLFFLLRALSKNDALANIHIVTVSNGTRQVENEPVPTPEKSMQDGPCRVATREFEGVTFKSVDLQLGEGEPPHGFWSDTRSCLVKVVRRLRNEVASAGESQQLRWDLLSKRQRCDEVNRRLYREILTPASNVTVAYRNGRRFECQYTEMREPTAHSELRGVCDGGTYLITGGLGGIGLTIAEAMATQANITLLLIGRTGLPPRAEWPDWKRDRTDSNICRVIATIERIEAQGSHVEAGSVDVTDLEELGGFVQDAEARYGRIRGVVHAAGVVNDSLMSLKTVDEVEEVFAPKVYGTVVLDMVFRQHALDFFILFSSSSTIVVPAGQADYVAANAFLNAFAQSRSVRKQQRVIAINWGVWNEVGMAAEATQQSDIAVPAKHPLYRHIRDTSIGKVISLVPLSVASHWLLDEHRLADARPVMPGTASVELFVDAFAEIQGRLGCEIRDLQFVAPLTVDGGASTRARIKFEQHDDGWNVELQSYHRALEGSFGWLTHSTAKVVAAPGGEFSRLPLAKLRDRCQTKTRSNCGQTERDGQNRHMRFGPRWQVLHEIRYGNSEALAELELPTCFADDVRHYQVHPALLDMATGCAMQLIEGYDAENAELWVPKSYRRILIHDALPTRLFSWIRNHGSNQVDDDTATFDVTIADASGRCLIEVEGFTIQKIAQRDLLATIARVPMAALEPDRIALPDHAWKDDLDPVTRALYHNVRQGILPEEGMRAFNKVVAGCARSEVVVSSLDLNALSEQTQSASSGRNSVTIRFQRPSLDNDYVCAKQ